MNNNLPMKCKKNTFQKIKSFILKLFDKKNKKDELPQEKKSYTESKENQDIREKLHKEQIKENNKKQILEIVDKNPKLIKTISDKRLRELNLIYEEELKRNQNKLLELEVKRKIENKNSISVIKQNLKENYNATYILKFYFNENTYIQAIKNDSFKTIYFKAENNVLNQITDQNIISIFKELYEIKPSNVVYLGFKKKNIDIKRELQTKSPHERHSFLWNLMTESKTSLIIDFLVRDDVENEDKLYVTRYLFPYETIILEKVIERYKIQAKKAKLPEKEWFKRREDAEFIKELLCSIDGISATDEEKVALLRDSIPRSYTNLWEEVICTLKSYELKKKFLPILQKKGYGHLLQEKLQKESQEKIRTQEYRDYIISFVSEALEEYGLFTKIFGSGFARERMQKLNEVILHDAPDELKAGSYFLYDESIHLYNVQKNSLQEFIKREGIKRVILHESIHHILAKGDGVTGIQTKLNDDEVGRGLNEGYTEWICTKKTGIECNNGYVELQKFIEQIELAIGEENTMRLGLGNIMNYPNPMGISFNDLFTLLKKADAVYQIGIADGKRQTQIYNDAVYEVESTLFELFFEKEFEELKKQPLDEVDLSKFERLAELMTSKPYESQEFASARFLKELDRMQRSKDNPLLAELLNMNPNLQIEFYERMAIALNEYILKDTNPIESIEIIVASSDSTESQNVVILANGKDVIRGNYTAEKNQDEQYKFINHTETEISQNIIKKFEKIREETLANNPNAQIIITDYSILIRNGEEEIAYIIDDKNDGLVRAEKIESVKLNIPESLRMQSEERKAYVLRNKIKEQKMRLALLENIPTIDSTMENDKAEVLE